MSALSQKSSETNAVSITITEPISSNNINDFKKREEGEVSPISNKDPEWVIKAMIDAGHNPDDFEDAHYID